MAQAIRIPKRFYNDHVARDLKAPAVIRKTKQHYIIDATPSSAFDELLSDALFYADGDASGFDMSDPDIRGIVASARATARALEAAH
jgi:hypothetical protein